MINSKPNYRPVAFSGPGYYEVNGAHAQTMHRALQWDKVDALGVLSSRVVSDSGVADSVWQTMVYRGMSGGDTVGLLYGQLNEPLRMFGVDDQVHFDALLAELKKNHGFLDQQASIVGDILTDNNAKALYAWQDNFFGTTAHIRKVGTMSGVSIEKTKELTKGTRAQFLEPGEALDLVKDIAVKYNIYNVAVRLGPYVGGLLGSCAPNQDNFVPYTMPLGVNLFFAQSVLYRDTVIHEMAHAIEMFHYGLSGHGKNFRKTFGILLKQYHDINPVGL